MLNFTLMPVMVALAGTPATVILLIAPAGEASGTTILMAPELTVNEPGTGGGAAAPVDNNKPLIPATPPQPEVGVTVTTGTALIAKMAPVEILAVPFGAQVPVSTQR